MGHATYGDQNECPGNEQFKGTNYMKNLKNFVTDNFNRSFANQLSGFEITNLVESFIRTNTEKKCEGDPRDPAVRVSFMLLQEGYIRPISGGETSFIEDRKSFYRLGNHDEIQSVVILHRTMKSRESSCDRAPPKPVRRGSFSRILQSPLIRRASASRASSKTTLTSTPSSSSTSHEEDELLDVEARLFEFALARLLTLVDIPQIEELVDMQLHCGDKLKEGSTANLLTSILSKMGLMADEEDGADSVSGFLIKKNRRAEMVHNYFKSVRTMCPRLQLQLDRSMDEYDQAQHWGRQALKAVANRLDSITRNGYSPLIPREFCKLVSAISILPKDKLTEALIYLCGMIPHKLRKELFLVIHFLSQCESTNLIFRLCDSHQCKTDPTMDLGENLSHAIDSLRTFIIPQMGMDLVQQRYVISTLVGIQADLLHRVADLKEEALSRCSPVPARFCEAVEEDSATDRQLADLIVLILKDDRLSQPDKFKKLQLMQTQHPRAYAIYMRNLH
ncbi:hypothetical protein PMAYCL1PPCAC_07254 [Pristionchus mayeri]|uniref:DEP domain-containing protein n=1 Tax=Pristionchus mayeri TaxID=1317129 RepID=A0AAN4ZBR5_9BILA|nr:hypothetical protein PMAYCL1PPCAC_07254 [Pristionchus mayeri]